jgi:TetR/AcrR family transcriptional regulator
MASSNQKQSRRDQILQALAHMLETSPGQRITTARLAAEVGVSEAALYRHFPSKARMFEGLIDFIEDSLLSRVNLIMAEEKDTMARCHHILQLLLVFAERNPGITRILNGDALLGEHDRLRDRISVLFDKLETQIKQVLRERLRKARASSSTRPCWPTCCWPIPRAASASSSAPSSKSSPPPGLKISGSLSAASCCRADTLNLQSVAATPLQTGCSKEEALASLAFCGTKEAMSTRCDPACRAQC